MNGNSALRIKYSFYETNLSEKLGGKRSYPNDENNFGNRDGKTQRGVRIAFVDHVEITQNDVTEQGQKQQVERLRKQKF